MGAGPAQDQVDVWWARLADADASFVDLLSDVERLRYAGYRRPDDQRRFLLGCAVTRLALARYLDIAADAIMLERRCPDCARPHGKVTVAGHDIHLSITHGGDRVGVAFAQGHQVGLDVEPLDARVEVALVAPRVLAPAELARFERTPAHLRHRDFMKLWTRKEAIVKCVGVGMRSALRELEVTDVDEPPAVVAWPDHGGDFQLTDLAPDAAHVACVAVRADGPITVAVRDATELPGFAADAVVAKLRLGL